VTPQPEPDIVAFIAENSRFPHLGDPVNPWDYRGWLLPYVFNVPACVKDLPDRWDYLQRTVAAGKLLDEPIPRITFLDSYERSDTMKQVMKWIDLVDRYEGGWSSFLRLIEWLAWALGVSKYQPKMREGADEALYRAINIIPLLQNPSDYFGAILAEHRGGGKTWNPNAFYPTPHNVCEMMAQMLIGADEGDLRKANVCDPCVGTGRMLLHASNFSMCLYGMDIDQTVCTISKINGVLYAPWMVVPLPAAIIGHPVPAPPPAPLPLPHEQQPEPGTEVFRCDDKGQGMLF